MKKFFIFVLTLVIFGLFGLASRLSNLAVYAADSSTSVFAQNGYDINGDGIIDEQDYDMLSEKLVNQISKVSDAPGDLYWRTEPSDIEEISVSDLVRLKRVIVSCFPKEISEGFRWDKSEQRYVWDTCALPITDDGIATIKALFKGGLASEFTRLPDGSVELKSGEIYTIRWNSNFVVDGGSSLPNPERWIASYYGDAEDKIGYHAYIEGDGGFGSEYCLMVSSRDFDFALEPYDGMWTWFGSELVPSEYGMGKLQEYLSNMHSHQVNELPDGSYEIIVDTYYRLFFDKNYVVRGYGRPNPTQIIATLKYDDGIYSVYADSTGYRLFVNDNDETLTDIGTAYFAMKVHGEVDSNTVSTIKEMFGDDNYVEKVDIANGYTEIDIKSFSGGRECVLYVEPKIINDAFMESEVITKFYVDGMIYNLFLSTRYDGQQFVYITTTNTGK